VAAMVLSVLRLIFAALLFWVGCRTIVIGFRDGMVRRRIPSRWYRDQREIAGNTAFWYGTTTSLVGCGVVGLAIWLALTRV
jgi:hypothetical protein